MTKPYKKRPQKSFDYSKRIVTHFNNSKLTSISVPTILKSMKVPPQSKNTFFKAIDFLVKKRILSKKGDILFFKTKELSSNTTSGIIHVNQRGFGFVTPSDGSYNEDVFIPRHVMNNAFDKDTVEILVSKSRKPNMGPEGSVLRIIKRHTARVVGIITKQEKNGKYQVFAITLGKEKPIQLDSKGKTLSIGMRVIMQIDDYGDRNNPIQTSLLGEIGHIDDPRFDIESAILDYQILSTFSTDVTQEAKSFGTKVSKKDCENRIDFTKTETFTIDPETARDFDDALSLSKDKKGNYHLLVHIADVTHYVKPESLLDKEAKLRGNSTYFVGQCIPMLPHELSNELCSLKEKVIRLTVTVSMEFEPDGTLVNYRIDKGFINSQKRYTYEQAKDIIDGNTKSKHKKTLDMMVELCLLLKEKRRERGSIDFSLPDVVLLADENGMPTGAKTVEYDISHQLVEEFMLKANEMVATYFVNRDRHSVFRIHETANDENLKEFYNTARFFGFAVPAKPTTKDLQNLFNEAKNSPHYHMLSIAYIRSMKLAAYSHENVGHFGLSLENYCHFTSPIRRYSDLMVHRLLFDVETASGLQEVSKHLSETERRSFKAEMNVLKMKKHRLLLTYYMEDPDKEYQAFITKIKPNGIFFEVTSCMLEGFIPLSQMNNDYYEYHPKRNMLIGSSSGEVFRNGDPLLLQLSNINLVYQETKWELLEHNSH